MYDLTSVVSATAIKIAMIGLLEVKSKKYHNGFKGAQERLSKSTRVITPFVFFPPLAFLPQLIMVFLFYFEGFGQSTILKRQHYAKKNSKNQ